MNIDKGSAVFKHLPEDFIVEEVWPEYVCQISKDKKELDNAQVDFGKLDVNDRRDFLYCELEKINIDHFFTVDVLAKKLHNYPIELGYAGTKDKAAWTCQRISIFNANIEKIKEFSHPGIILKNFKWAKHKIKVGDASANKFTVVLRDVDKDAIKILSRVRNAHYLPNYFGNQRFGSLRNDNVKIGTFILKKKFEMAVFAFLIGFGDKEKDEVIRAKLKLKSDKNILKAKEYFPQELHAEHKIIEYLSKNNGDWCGALKLLGEKTLLIMIQSVQSQLFNDVLSQIVDKGINYNSITLNLLGHNSRISDDNIGRIEKEVLQSYNLETKDFLIVEVPFLSQRASLRKASFEIKELDVRSEDDELFPPSKKIILSFILDSGTYATTFLDQFFDLR